MNRNYNQDPTLISRHKKKSKLPLFGCLGLLAILILLGIAGGIFYTTRVNANRAALFIRTPQNGEMLIAGNPVQVSALARDEKKITRIELWIDGKLIDMQSSATKNGITPFPLLTTWYPQEGTHTLIVRAFNTKGKSLQSTIYVGAITQADNDADGLANERDACPDQAGSLAAAGCPDRDFDGIADSADSCPDQAGLPPDGCPAPNTADQDGDGILNSADRCPDTIGSPLANGCPDADADGIADADDACPSDPGAGADGCALAADEPERESEEETGTELLADEEPPVPGEDDNPPEGLDFFRFFPQLTAYQSLEIEAYLLYIREPYEKTWCYIQLEDEDPRRYDFSLEEGYQSWNIGEELGGENSLRILHAATDPLEIFLVCFGANGDDMPQEIHRFAVSHPPEEWDGRALSLHPEGENTIQVGYHICSPSCDETALASPQLDPITIGTLGNGPYTLHWQWRGDESEISGFVIKEKITASDERLIWTRDPSQRSIDLADYLPACGETAEFEISTFRQTESEISFSAPSNTRTYSADPCTYTANITFTTMDVHDPPRDEDRLHRPGPVYGAFWVSDGTTTQSITFNACWCYLGPGMSIWGWCDGLSLMDGVYAINRGIFDWIRREQASCLGRGCHSNSYTAPASSTISIPFEDGGDLTLGSRIMDCDAHSRPDVLFEEQETLTINVSDLNYISETIPGSIEGNHININYFIRMGE